MIIRITYDNNTTQYFKVISHKNEYLKIIKPLKYKKHELESSKNLLKKNKKEYFEILEKLKKYNFKWCTDESPIYESLKTGILLLTKNQGYKHKVTTVIIEN